MALHDFPREPVPAEAAIRPATLIFLMVSNAAVGVPVMILGASLGHDYGLNRSLLVILVGCAITALLGALTAYAGGKSRRSTALIAERAFGSSGALLLNFAIAVGLLGWFSVEMGFAGEMVATGFRNVFGWAAGREPGVILASTVICAICLFGIALVSRAPMLFLPLLAILTAGVLFLALRAPPLATVAAVADVHPLGSGISAIVGAYIIGCLIMPDYSRFVRSSSAAAGATALSIGGVYGLALAVYAFAGAVTGAAFPSDILLRLGLPAAIGLVLPIGLLQNGIMCLYSSALASSTLLRTVSFRMVLFVSAVSGMTLALAGADSYFVKFLVFLGIIFPPAASVIVFAGLVPAMVDTGRGSKIRWAEIAVWFFGIVCGAASEFQGLGLTGFSAFDGLLVSAFASIVLLFVRNRAITTGRRGGN